MDSLTSQQFGAITNLTISASVVVFGAFWLLQLNRSRDVYFRYYSFLFWWCAWITWVLAWAIILFKQTSSLFTADNYPPELAEIHTRIADIAIFALDDLNAIFLIIVYFALTRGNYGIRRGFRDFAFISTSLTLAYVMLYGALWAVYENSAFHFAFELHRTWGLCLSVLAPIIVGWGLWLKFGTIYGLVIGFLYGFAQPLVYATELPVPSSAPSDLAADLLPIVGLVLAFLKVLWAILCVRILYSAKPTKDEIVAKVNEGTFRIFTSKWPNSVAIYATFLTLTYIVIAIFMTAMSIRVTASELVTSIGLVSAIITILSTLAKLYGNLRSDGGP